MLRIKVRCSVEIDPRRLHPVIPGPFYHQALFSSAVIGTCPGLTISDSLQTGQIVTIQ